MNRFEHVEVDGIDHYLTLRDRHIEVWADDELTAYLFITDQFKAAVTYQMLVNDLQGLLWAFFYWLPYVKIKSRPPRRDEQLKTIL